MANKFIMEELQNAVMNEIIDWHKNNICHPAALVKLSEREIGDCRLRDYLLHEIASDMHFRLGVFTDGTEEDVAWCAFFKAGCGDDTYKITQHLLEPCGLDSEIERAKEDPCHYYIHTTTEKCT